MTNNWVRNQCKCCGVQVGDPKAALVAHHYCKSMVLASRYGGAERTYRNVVGHIEGWHEWRPCSVCRTMDEIVAHKPSGLQDRVWCREHVGKLRGRKRDNPFAAFVTACYNGRTPGR